MVENKILHHEEHEGIEGVIELSFTHYLISSSCSSCPSWWKKWIYHEEHEGIEGPIDSIFINKQSIFMLFMFFKSFMVEPLPSTLLIHNFHFSIEQGLRPCTPLQSVKEQSANC